MYVEEKKANLFLSYFLIHSMANGIMVRDEKITNLLIHRNLACSNYRYFKENIITLTW